MNIFQRIAAALVLLQSGVARADSPELQDHLNAIDQHLVDTDAHEAADNADQETRIAAIEQGLGQIADTVAPAPAPEPAPAPTPEAGAADGDQAQT